MKISKALKVKNRLVQELSVLEDTVRSNNVYNENICLQYNASEEYTKYINKLEELITLKSKIQKANGTISRQLTEQAELKGLLTQVRSIPVKSGIENQGFRDNLVKVQWHSHLDNKFIKEECERIQNRINDLQDEIDEYNALTDI